MAVKFLKKDEAQAQFLQRRKEIKSLFDSSKYAELKEEIESLKNQARKGDVVAMDTLAYLYRDGLGSFVLEDYYKYIAWELLAGYRGNEFAIEKLQFFINYAYDDIIADPDFGFIKYKFGIDEFNYTYVLGQLICEAIVADLDLTETKVFSMRERYNPYTAEIFRDWRKAIDNVLPRLIEILKLHDGYFSKPE